MTLDEQEAIAARRKLQSEMDRAVPRDLMADIVADSRRSREPSSILPQRPEPPPAHGTGWVEAKPLAPFHHIDLIDRMVERLGPKPWTGDR